MIGVIYARYSAGPRQTDQSIEGQIADCKAYAEREGIEIVEIYADRHVSGKNITGRSEFQRMLYDAGRKKFDCVLVWKIDRFGRNRFDMAVSQQALNVAGVRLISVMENIPEGPSGIILQGLLESLAEYYSADLAEKINRGMRESAKKGKWPCAAVPPGYKKDADGRVQVDEEAAQAIREAFDMHIAGATISDIRDHLTRSGIRGARSGEPVGNTFVGRMLRNEKYIGKWVTRGIEVDIPGIIDENTFMEAQRHMKTSRNNASGKAVIKYLLSSKCTCGYCGAYLIGESGRGRNGDQYRYYTCGEKKNKKSDCEYKTIPADKLENAIIDATIKLVLTPEVIERLINDVHEIQNSDSQSRYIDLLKDELKKAEKSQKNVIKAIEESGALKGLPERLQEINDEIEDLEVRIKQEEASRKILSEDLISAWLASFLNGDVDDPDYRKAIVGTFIDHVEVKNDEALIVYNLLQGSGFDRFSSTISLVDQTGSYSNHNLHFNNPIAIERFILLRIKLVA